MTGSCVWHLKSHLHGELQLTGGGGAIRLCCRAAGEAERTGIAQIVVWLRKLHPVEQVIEFKASFEFHPIPERCVFGYHHVPVIDSRPGEAIASDIARNSEWWIAAKLGNAKGAQGNPGLGPIMVGWQTGVTDQSSTPAHPGVLNIHVIKNIVRMPTLE